METLNKGKLQNPLSEVKCYKMQVITGTVLRIQQVDNVASKLWWSEEQKQDEMKSLHAQCIAGINEVLLQIMDWC
jgi:hypothetical protein